ncbi:MAG TPA: hypothetical protein VHJ78_02520 [Actinomycetota bacterium]|nr:hypothetical protein [Actinomycetota bacterium]
MLRTPPPASLRLAALALACVLATACSGRPPSQPASEPAPIRVDWNDENLAADLGGGWEISRCPTAAVALCVAHDGAATGHILLEDLPSIGQEATTSRDQIQATLAVRTQTVYQVHRRQRQERCGQDYQVDTSVPRPVPVAGGTGLRYEATGAQGGRVVERTIGFRTFRDGIETLLEATAIQPGTCLTPESPTFTVPQLRDFEGLLERVIAGSVLPPPTEYAAAGPAQPGGSKDPRLERPPANGVAISHGLGLSR